MTQLHRAETRRKSIQRQNMGQHAKKAPKAVERTPERSKSVILGLAMAHMLQRAAEAATEAEATTAVRTLLSYIGEDPDREGLKETPRRVVKAWDELTQGYGQDPATILATDFDGAGYDEMVVCRNVEFVSVCEHHLLPFLGVAHVAYVPRTRVVGLSKMGRLVDCFARRLQIQEKMTQEIAEAMRLHLNPRGVGVTIIAKHLCMACRGVRKQQSEMVTSCLLGVFKAPAVRAEFFNHCRNGGH
jgi:GTP cyclohydrolase I